MSTTFQTLLRPYSPPILPRYSNIHRRLGKTNNEAFDQETKEESAASSVDNLARKASDLGFSPLVDKNSTNSGDARNDFFLAPPSQWRTNRATKFRTPPKIKGGKAARAQLPLSLRRQRKSPPKDKIYIVRKHDASLVQMPLLPSLPRHGADTVNLSINDKENKDNDNSRSKMPAGIRLLPRRRKARPRDNDRIEARALFCPKNIIPCTPQTERS
mmetsp:Transcript_25467/g.54328  ORF Transcript_25467/g.54328 Transcript_25467/m.54328 type:complete len:215 (+) Transcript_25467:67-711(+)